MKIQHIISLFACKQFDIYALGLPTEKGCRVRCTPQRSQPRPGKMGWRSSASIGQLNRLSHVLLETWTRGADKSARTEIATIETEVILIKALLGFDPAKPMTISADSATVAIGDDVFDRVDNTKEDLK